MRRDIDSLGLRDVTAIVVTHGKSFFADEVNEAVYV